MSSLRMWCIWSILEPMRKANTLRFSFSKARYREGLAYEAGKYEVESYWHAVAITAEMFHDYCEAHMDKKDAK